ncbi:hypothetical protein MBM_00801 [Drepanopeziza brunnea f. sp. 'multigermtubi' MB_m1]|uniref:Uncharacterized protein n=2 Tax=Drepanopeziza brunnea f. sp. 'multigermtubi' TaxID=698441 RepID=K1XMF6_MARBU|nr:uncharacterized protein MBM_00801 [Drepanopeziza brunnea f. sp. 'multigermtubi' MB_m1]EKD21688.1 hypothetical protein MBM_00801 [Drepanopeziza brunnea f. sp. 'multigermtubi' MB_m1]
MQPSRPKIPQRRPFPPTPSNQQQTRTLSTPLEVQGQVQQQVQQQPTYNTPPLQRPRVLFPRSQIEAMPPFAAPAGPAPRNALLAVARDQQIMMLLDAATRHPVFFTERLKKAPRGVDAGSGKLCSPVAEGYVYEDGVGRGGRGEGGVKL